MSEHKPGYEIRPFPSHRKIVLDALHMARHKSTLHGLFEVDVTKARNCIREHKARTGETLSFTAFLLTCLGKAVEADKRVHAYRNWRGELVLFDDVDVTTLFEIELDDQTFPFAHVIRAVNRKSHREIHEEIRAIQAQPGTSEGLVQWRFIRWFLALPAFVRNTFFWFASKNPHWWKRYAGTVALTAVGMFGDGGGWGIGLANHNLGVTVGGIVKKPGVVDDRIQIREYLGLTLDFDHAIIDGAPAARFAKQFKQLIERAYGLSEYGPNLEGQ